MKAFRIHRNGKSVCTASIGPQGVLTAMVTWVRRDDGAAHESLDLDVGGLDTVAAEHHRWSVPEMLVGDQVLVEVIDAEEWDQPQEREPVNREGGG